jgi:hypothetical protein
MFLMFFKKKTKTNANSKFELRIYNYILTVVIVF